MPGPMPTQTIIPAQVPSSTAPAIVPPTHKFLDGPGVCIIGAPMCEGQGHSGVALGPNAIRKGGLKEIIGQAGRIADDRGDICFSEFAAHNEENLSHGGEGATNTKVCGVKNCAAVGKKSEVIFNKIASLARENKMVLTLGGDHGIASATIKGMLSVYPDLAVVWVDAHGDCNTPETSPSGNYHGMPLAHALGWFGTAKKQPLPGFEWEEGLPVLPEERTALIGLRDIDENEKKLLNNSAINLYPMRKVDEMGIGKVIKDALTRIDPSGTRPIHLSFDVDGCDPSIAHATGTRSRGGLSWREAHYICESVAETRRLVSMDLVEVNTDFETEEPPEHGDRVHLSAGATVRLAVELIGSALGTQTL